MKHGIAELEKEFERRQDDLDYLKVLHHELTFRSVPRALKLRSRVEAILGIEPEPTRREAPKPLARLESNPAPVPAPEPPALPQPFDPDSFPSHAKPEDSSQGPPPPITDAPEEILAAWTALEALSPQSFRRPEDLAGGDRTAVAWLDRGRLPWEGSGEKARPKTRLYYQVILGTIDLGKATALLLARYTDSRAERPGARGEAALAVVTVDQAGLPVGEPAVSSFAWALPRALRGGLAELAEWRRAEKPLVEKLDEILRRGDEEKELPLDGPMLQAAFGWLAASLGLPADLISPPRFAVRAYTSLRNPEPPEPLLLNSFYLDDLVKARTLFTEGGSTRNLRLYLGQDAPAQRRDLLNDLAALEETVEPRRIPPARWPGPGRHPLVLLQQAAVNLGIEELKDGGVFAVNGPP
ncbi:MAG TPA: helicase, partial [Thermoanaerobaculia bacterium]|nr:helicase [Thermoanaerobaculia bacterium]